MATHQIANSLASMGRNGDSMLMHVQPREVAGLQALAEANGTNLTINPNTGMPEAFNLGGILGAIAPIAAGFALGPGGFGLMKPLAAGLTVGAAATALSGGDLGKGIMAGLGGYGGAGLGGKLSSAGAKASEQMTAANTTKDAFQAGNLGASYTPPTTAQIGGANLYSPAASKGMTYGNGQLGPTMGQVNKYVQPPQMENQLVNQISRPADLGVSAPRSAFENTLTGTKNLFTPEGWGNFKAAGGSGGELAMMGGSALLGGLEESDIYGKPLKAPEDKYDPYATLNLGGASSEGGSGLRLLAGGGPIAFKSGGSPALEGGGSGAMEGAAPMRISVTGGSNPAVDQGMATWMGGLNQYGGLSSRGNRVAPEELGLFADQSMIDAARERQNNALRSQTSLGMYRGMGGMNQPYMGMGGMNRQHPGMGGMLGFGGSMGRQNDDDNDGVIGSLNLKDHTSLRLNGGGAITPVNTIQSGGIRDLYGKPDDQIGGAQLSQDGYGLGRLQSMTQNQNQGFAEGGSVANPTTSVVDKTSSREIGAPNTGVYNTNAIPGIEGLATRPELSAVSEINPGMAQEINPNAGYAEGGLLEGYGYGEHHYADLSKHVGFAKGGLSEGYNLGEHHYADLSKHVGFTQGGYLDGPGDGMSDSIPATIEGKQPARLADGEFVIPADVVSHLGNGSTKAGSQRLYTMLDKVRHARTGNKKQGKQINAGKYLPT
jgi:hypothetical protein